MRGLSSGRAIVLWAAGIVAAFALGRLTAPSAETPAPEDLGAAIRAALAEGNALERTAQTTRLLGQLDPETLPGVVGVYDGMLTIIDKYDIRPFVIAWTRFDPADALDHVLAWPYRIKQETGVEAAIYGWAQRDPLAARLSAEQVSLEYPHFSEPVFHSLVAGWAHSDHEGLDRYIGDLSEGPRDSAVGIAVGALMRRGGADATLEWADGILRNEDFGDRYKLSVFRRATRSAARSDPERATIWTLQHVGNDYAVDRLRIVAERWGERDGLAAMAWVREQPEGEPREAAVREAFVSWLKSDPQRAVEWLENETLSAFHDPAISVFAARVGDRAPVSAIDWCERITDPRRRNGCLKTAATKWYQRDAVAAEAWLQESPLDEEMRGHVRLLSEKSKRRGRLRAAQRDR